MLWKKTIEKDLLCPPKGEWSVEVTVPVIQAVPPPCFKEKEQFYCCSAKGIMGSLECQVAVECWHPLKGKLWDVREGMQVEDDGEVGYFFWHVSPALDRWELLVDWRVTFTVVFFVDFAGPVLHSFGDLEFNQDGVYEIFRASFLNVLFFWFFWKKNRKF